MKNTQLLNKFFNFFILICITFLYNGCSSSDDGNDNELNNTTNHLVKREYISNNIYLEYRYDESGHLTRIIDIDNHKINEKYNSETSFTYDSDNIVTENLKSNISSFSSITNYSYNGSNRLLNVVSTITDGSYMSNISQEFTYKNNNTITVNRSSNKGQPSVITLEVNSSGLVTKMIETDYYTIINYDSNENISEIKFYNSNDDLSFTSEFVYDYKPNPFYGKLKSIYLPLFLEAFEDIKYGEVGWDGYSGYYFPFLKNNVTSIIENGNSVGGYDYLYDNQNYPIRVIEVFNGINYEEFDIEYH